MRGVRIAFLLLLTAALLWPSASFAAPTEAQRLAAELATVKSRAQAAGQAYDRSYWRLDETEVRLGNVSARERRTRARLKVVRDQLADRANGMYRSGAIGFMEVMFGSRSFEEVVVRLDYFQRVGNRDAAMIEEAEKLTARLTAQRRQLVVERRKRANETAELRRRRDVLQAQLSTSQKRYDVVRRQLAAAVRAERDAGQKPSWTPPRGPNGMIFPVAGPNTYADTWGASRSGGRRRHQGTDIMAARGTPCVAVQSGTVSARENSLGGKTIWLTTDNGWQFYYAHLDTYTVTSGRVRAGQTIGTVGDTGNARGGSPHLHFEIHPGGGAAVNPYPYLRAME